nr:MAG TPA: hypothetical protein [Caudoviricetes sp.]
MYNRHSKTVYYHTRQQINGVFISILFVYRKKGIYYV